MQKWAVGFQPQADPIKLVDYARVGSNSNINQQ